MEPTHNSTATQMPCGGEYKLNYFHIKTEIDFGVIFSPRLAGIDIFDRSLIEVMNVMGFENDFL